MQNEILESFTMAGKSSYAAMKELGAINSNLLKQMTELQFGFATNAIQDGVKQVEVLGSKTNIKDILNAQAEYANKYISKIAEFNRKTVEAIKAAQEDAVVLVEKNIDETIVKPEKPKTQRATKKATN